MRAAVRARRIWSVVAVLAAMTWSGCATNPATGDREFSLMSEAQEIEIGEQLDPEVRRELGVYDDRALQEYVEDIGMRLARSSPRPNLPWHFTIIDEAAVNAFALPGGYIYITRGILPYLDSEAQLAGVLGHEIGHVTARHAAQAYTRATGTGIGLTVLSIFVPAARPFGQLAETAVGVAFLKYSRDDELQADRLGAEYAAKGGWQPGGVAEMLNTLARIEETAEHRGVPNWLATHPQPADRVQKVQAVIQQLSTNEEAFVANREDFLRHLEGVTFGDSPQDGIVRGSELLHPDMRFAVKFPEGWEVDNGQTQVVAKEPGQERYMVLQLADDARGSVEDIAVRGMRQAGYRQREGGRTTINGLDAYIGTYEGSVDKLGKVVTRAAYIHHERNVFVIAGIAQPNAFETLDRAYNDAIRSFRPLTRNEALEIRPNRIEMYTVQAGDTWQSIAQRSTAGNVKASTLAIMNDHAVAEQPTAGSRIKIVVAG